MGGTAGYRPAQASKGLAGRVRERYSAPSVRRGEGMRAFEFWKFLKNRAKTLRL